MTEKDLNLPRLEDDMDIARAANDARVAIDTFQVGGLEAQSGGYWTDQSPQTFAFKGLRVIAKQTGGVSSSLNGQYRKIEVRTRRPNVTLLYRRGYYGRTEVGSYNRRDAVTRERLMAAAGFRREVNDIRVKLDASQQKNPGGVNEVSIRTSIDTSRLFLSLVDGHKVGTVDVLAVCFNDKGQTIGQFYQRASIDLTGEMFDRVSRTGLPYAVKFEASPATRKVRVVVYDYRADLVGSADKSVF